MSKTKHRHDDDDLRKGKHVRNHIKSGYDKKNHKLIDQALKKAKNELGDGYDYDDDRYLPYTY